MHLEAHQNIERERTMPKALDATEQFEESKSKYAQREQKSELGQDRSAKDIMLISMGDINFDIDPITESLRKEILEKQREQLRLYFSSLAATRPELAEHSLDDMKFQKFLSNLNEEQRKLVNAALANEKVKAEMEQIELEGYKNIHTRFRADPLNPNGFKPMDWSDFTEGNSREVNSRTQIVRNEAGAEIATLKEQTHKTTPLTISKQDGTEIIVSSYRTIDLPVNLEEPASGTMHLSLVARDKDGKAPSTERAVYFTAHYEATPKPNGVPKLKEVSSPVPIKFLGSSKDAIGYIEHGGEIYTLPVTKGKYQEMIKEVAKNKGQAMDVSQAVERKAQDLIGVAEKVGMEGKLQEAATTNNICDSKQEEIKYHESQIEEYQKILKEHIEPALNARDQEREKILELTKKCFTDAKYKELTPYIRKTAKQHIEMHHEAYLAADDEGKALSELSEIMQNIGYKSFEAENTKNNSRGAVGQIKEVLKAGAKLGFNVVLESVRQGGFENYLRQQAVNQTKKVGSYVAYSIADRLKSKLCGIQASSNDNNVSAKAFKSCVVSASQSKSKAPEVSR
ncbi:cell surface protein [Rickettsia sp. wb]|nr:cell surface protein [Rickettsia sp. wq]ODA37841.1 cell surface protein [Rickettsia sp. wb]